MSKLKLAENLSMGETEEQAQEYHGGLIVGNAVFDLALLACDDDFEKVQRVFQSWKRQQEFHPSAQFAMRGLNDGVDIAITATRDRLSRTK